MGHIPRDLAFPRERAAEQWEINVLKTSLLLNISTSRGDGGADRETMAPTLEATVLWFRHAGVFRAADQATLAVLGTGAEGVGGQHGRG